MSFSLKLLSQFEAYSQGCKKKGCEHLLQAFDEKSFAELCKKNDKAESKPLPEPNTLIPLPEEKEGGTLDVKLFRNTSWFAYIEEKAGEDKALLRFNVQKRLERYCELVKEGNYLGDLMDFTSAFVIVFKYVVERERDIHFAESHVQDLIDHASQHWVISVKDEMFLDEGKRKFNVLYTFLIDVEHSESAFYCIINFFSGVPVAIEKIQVVDFYNYSLSTKSRGSVQKTKSWADVAKCTRGSDFSLLATDRFRDNGRAYLKRGQ